MHLPVCQLTRYFDLFFIQQPRFFVNKYLGLHVQCIAENLVGLGSSIC